VFDTYGQLRRFLDGSDPFMSGGHQILVSRRISRKIPVWSKSDVKVRELLKQSFPKLTVNPRQRKSAADWARVICLYFRMGLPASHVAAEMAVKPKDVQNIVQRLRLAAAGEQTNGSGRRLGKRRRGRPEIK
jgi:hypothetical protein